MRTHPGRRGVAEVSAGAAASDARTSAATPEGHRSPTRQRVRRALLLAFLLLFPFTFNYYSPALPILGALQGVASFSLLFWAAWTVAALLVGRAACGFICPLGALQELWRSALERPVRAVRGLGALRWALGATWVGTIGWAIWRGGGLREVNLLFQTEHVVSWDGLHGAFIYGGMFGLVLLVALPLGGRAFCRHLCWWAPLNVVGARAGRALRLPTLRLGRGRSPCTGCLRCERACPAGLTPREVADGRGASECVLCGSCADACRSDALAYHWGTRRRDR